MSVVIGRASRPLPGETENGDATFVRVVGDATWFGVIDALGHGPTAALASSLALMHLNRADLTRTDAVGVVAVVQALHTTLRGTRGAAALLCCLRGETLTCCGVGNVELRRLGAKISAHVIPGVLGGLLARKLVAAVGTMPAGTRVVLYSDGISPKFDVDDVGSGDLDVAAAALLSRFARSNDDATVLIAEACA